MVKSPFKIVHDAEKIANVIVQTDTSIRGNLFETVATVLRLKSQHYTASILEKAAKEYGVKNV